MLDELTRILPERGYFTEFEMDGNHKITQTIQFDTKSEAAYYLHSLLAFDWVEEAVITQAKTETVLEEKGETDESENSAVSIVNEDNVLPRYFAKY
ncbi:PilN domain-containing protein [Niallia oryzisoli]